MRPGEWHGRVSTDNVRVLVNGVERPVRDVRVQSGMKDGHPAADSWSWCVEATIDWLSPHLVDAGAPEPFTGESWVPRDGDDVEILTGDGGAWWRQHVGFIDKTSGSFRDGTAQSQTVDRIDELSKPCQYVALLSTMTPALDGDPMRYQSLQSVWYVDRMLRDQSVGWGWHSTPSAWQAIAAVTSPGSLRPPEVGTLVSSTDLDPNNGFQWIRDSSGAPWPIKYDAFYRMASDANDFVMTFGMPWHTGDNDAYFSVEDDTGSGGVTFGILDDQIFVVWGTGMLTSFFPRDGVERAALYFHRTSTTDQTVTLRLEDGREFDLSTTTGNMPPNWRGTQVYVHSIRGISWWLVEKDKVAEQRWLSLEHVPTARIRVEHWNWWRASRDQERQSAAESLEEQLEAECATAWLDEDGVFQWAGRGVLEAQPVAQTVTSSLHVDDVQWATSRQDGARSVEIEYSHPRIDIGPGGAVSRELWSSDSLDAGPGETELVTVTVPSDEDWIAEDLAPTHIKSWGLLWDKYVHHSHYGGTQYRKSSSDEAAWAAFLDCTMTKTGLRDYEITWGPWASLSSDFRVKSDYPPNPGGFVRTGASPLVMRGRAKIKWVDRSKSKPTGLTSTAAAAARYVHPVGWRVQDHGTTLDDLLDWLAWELGHPRPTVALTVEHDPRRQIGDLIRVQDPDRTGSEITMLVQDRDFSAAEFTDTIRGRVRMQGRLLVVLDDGTIVRSTLPAAHGATPTTPAVPWDREET